jgi:hypothetical protein
LARQFDGKRGSQWNPLVRGAKNHVKLKTALDQSLCIELGQTTHLETIVKQTDVKEVGAHAASLGLKLAEAQYATVKYKTQKILRQPAGTSDFATICFYTL